MKITPPYFFLTWLVAGLVYGLQSYFSYAMRGVSCSFFGTLIYEVPNFILWGLYTPFIFYLFRQSRRNKKWYFFAAYHFPAVVLISSIHILLLSLYHFYLKIDPVERSFTELVSFYFSGWIYLQFVFYTIVLLAAYMLDFYSRFLMERENTLRLEKQVANAELRTLKSQLQPHFMFNTLNTISVLVRSNENSKAIDVISSYSQMLRKLLDHQSLQFVDFKNELELVEEYLSIEAVRFHERFEYRIDAEVDTLFMKIPHMILQPVVENAFKHGFVNSSSRNRIEISARVQTDCLSITITNNGSLLDPHRKIEYGVGLANVENRLQSIYNGRSSFSLENSLGKVKAIFKIPVLQ
ncbi:MAG: histidine kinase [Bacteroidetes bacterium]|nr:histidine kinase [Bacteroidota bacterium]